MGVAVLYPTYIYKVRYGDISCLYSVPQRLTNFGLRIVPAAILSQTEQWSLWHLAVGRCPRWSSKMSEMVFEDIRDVALRRYQPPSAMFLSGVSSRQLPSTDTRVSAQPRCHNRNRRSAGHILRRNMRGSRPCVMVYAFASCVLVVFVAVIHGDYLGGPSSFRES